MKSRNPDHLTAQEREFANGMLDALGGAEPGGTAEADPDALIHLLDAIEECLRDAPEGSGATLSRDGTITVHRAPRMGGSYPAN